MMGQPVFPVLTQHTKLKHLIGPKSWCMFSRFDDTDWLSKPVATWPTDAGYQEMFYHVRNLKVVNDTAERHVKLMEDLNDGRTKDEEQLQYLCHVVEEHRQILPRNSATI